MKHNGRTADRQCHVANDSTILPRFFMTILQNYFVAVYPHTCVIFISNIYDF